MKHKKHRKEVFGSMAIALVTILLSAGFMQTAQALLSQQNIFPDVDKSDPRSTAIEYFLDQNVFTGYPDGLFQPEKILNRAEQLKVSLLLIGANPPEDVYNNCFPDVKEEWFARFVCFAKEKGVVQGYPDGLFRPGQEVNKAEALKMLGVLEQWNVQVPAEDPFIDTPAGAWFAPYVAFAKDHNFLGTTSTTLHPAGGTARANTAELMFRSLALYALNQSFHTSLVNKIQEISLTQLAETKRTVTTETSQQAATITITNIEPQSAAMPVGQPYNLTIQVKNANGEPISDAPLEASLEWPYAKTGTLQDPQTPLTVTPAGNGVYNAQIVSTVAGSNTIAIQNKNTGEIVRTVLIFTPAPPSTLEVTEELPPEGELKQLGNKKYHLQLRDLYGNPLRETKFTAEATNAYITMQPRADGTAIVQVEADTYGLSQVVFTGSSQGVEKQQTKLLDFIPLGLHANAAYLVGTKDIHIPVLFFLPKYGDQSMEIDYVIRIPREFNVKGFVPKTTVFTGEIDQTLEAGVNYIRIKGHLILEKSFDGAIGHIVLEQMPEGVFTLDGGINITTEGSLPIGLHRPGGVTQRSEKQEIYVSLPRPLAVITGKTEKRICIDAFIDPAAGVTAEQVQADIQQAEDIFHKNAQSCNCPHWLKIDVSFYAFPQNQWSELTGLDGTLGNQDIVDYLTRKTPVVPHTWCTKVFYTPNGSGSEAGSSFRSTETDEMGGVGNFIVINNAKDKDGRTLSHELAHHLSGNMIQDPGKGFLQGAGAVGNLMSYSQAGDDLTKAQCDLISWNHGRFDAYPPQ